MSVRQPLWIINCILLGLFSFGLGLILLWQPTIPKPINITAKPVISQPKSVAPINTQSIYENDLFKTIDSSQEVESQDELASLPTPPGYQDFKPRSNHKPAFLEPLPITITGIMAFEDELDRRAIIMDNRSKIETIYKIGDDLEDAQIIRILRNKVVIVRANSQQETLFLREQDAIKELEAIDPNWSNILTYLEPNKYQVNLEEFIAQVTGLAQVLDALNLITAYQDGVAIGVKVGSGTSSPLVEAAGLQAGDIIKTINGIEVAGVDQRVAAYQNVIDTETKLVTLELIRQGQPLTIIYQLRPNPAPITAEPSQSESAQAVEQHVQASQSEFEDITQKIRKQDQKNAASFKNKISQSVEVEHDQK